MQPAFLQDEVVHSKRAKCIAHPTGDLMARERMAFEVTALQVDSVDGCQLLQTWL